MILNLGAGENSWNPALNKLGAKNLLENIGVSKSISNTDFFIRENKSVLVQRTPTADVWFKVFQSTIPQGEYVLSGCPAGGDINSYQLLLCKNSDTTDIIASDYGNGASFTIDNDTIEYAVFIHIKSGTQITNLFFKPMIRLASILDNTYEPYAMTNRELTESVDELAESVAGITPIPNAVQRDNRPITSGAVYDLCLELDNKDIELSNSITAVSNSLKGLIKFDQTVSASVSIDGGKTITSSSFNVVTPTNTNYNWYCFAITSSSSSADILGYSYNGACRVNNIASSTISTTVTWNWIGIRKDIM